MRENHTLRSMRRDWKRNQGSRIEAQRESCWTCHRTLPCARQSSTLPAPDPSVRRLGCGDASVLNRPPHRPLGARFASSA